MKYVTESSNPNRFNERIEVVLNEWDLDVVKREPSEGPVPLMEGSGKSGAKKAGS